jgi:hypothetical protein
VVLRAYDSRACGTERRPDVYLRWSELEATTGVVFDTAAAARAPGGGTDGSGFGERRPRGDGPSRMWAESGSRLLVISTPFVEGRHYAESPAEFVPLVDQLRRLHGGGFVHGDNPGLERGVCRGRSQPLLRLGFRGETGRGREVPRWL